MRLELSDKITPDFGEKYKKITAPRTQWQLAFEAITRGISVTRLKAMFQDLGMDWGQSNMDDIVNILSDVLKDWSKGKLKESTSRLEGVRKIIEDARYVSSCSLFRIVGVANLAIQKYFY